MSADAPAAAPPAPGDGYGRRFLILWLVASVILTPIVAIFLGPADPARERERPGLRAGARQHRARLGADARAALRAALHRLCAHALPRRDGSKADGPPDRGNSRIQIVWAIVTTVTVLSLATFGSYELVQDGAGGGQGPSPAFVPAGSSSAMDVQVIGQQWEFTYRYPSYGGLETAQLVLPADKLIRLHVTSLDVVHSFWAYQLGVKADANPGVDNVVYLQLKGPRTFNIRCAELCGLWHGYMYDTGRVVPQAEFEKWIASQKAFAEPVSEVHAALRAHLPPRADPPRRMSFLRRLIGFNLLAGAILGVIGWYIGYWLGHQITGPSIDYFGDTDQNDISIFLGYAFGTIGFLAGLGFLNYPLARMAGRPASRPPLRAEPQLPRHGDRPQGRRAPVPLGHRALLLHRRDQRDADPVRAPEPPVPALPGRPVPDRGRAPRHDDDGDHVERHPRAVRELLRSDHDRRPADGVPADRGALVLAADGRRRDPDDDDLLRRLPDRLDRVRAADRPGERRRGLLHLLLRARRDLDVPARAEPARRP